MLVRWPGRRFDDDNGGDGKDRGDERKPDRNFTSIVGPQPAQNATHDDLCSAGSPEPIEKGLSKSLPGQPPGRSSKGMLLRALVYALANVTRDDYQHVCGKPPR
jgi:hypothetical protein